MVLVMAIELELLAPPREPMSLVDGLAVEAPSGLNSCAYEPGDATALAEFLVEGVHADEPFEVAIGGPDDAVRVLCATVAALTGADIVAAVAEPDEARLAALNPMAQDALRERLRHLITADPQAVTDHLGALGLT